MSTRKPNFFIVGAPKCGTTSMVEYLHQHPQIYMPKMKDLYFFGKDLDVHRAAPTEEEYLAYFAEAGNAVHAGESSVQYIRSTSAPQEIADYCEAPRIMIMLRNPVDFLYSYQGQLVYHLEEDILDFEEAMRAQADRAAGRRLPAKCAPSKLQYFKLAAFDEHVARWFDVFGREPVHVVLMDDMRADMPGVYRRALEWLGVDADFTPSFERTNEKRWLTAPSVLKLFRRVPVVRTAVMKIVPKGMRRKAGNAISKATRVPERKPMSPAFHAELLEHFRPSIERLSELLQRDLSHWYTETSQTAPDLEPALD